MDRLTTMEAFVRVVDAGSFSAAARGWSVSKAVVSKYVAALEGQLGVELLRRTTRALSLTDAGRTYYDRCVVWLDEVAQVEASLRDEHEHPRGRLRVTAPPGFMTRFGPQMTTDFRQRYPEVQLELQLTHRMVDLVEDGIDVAIRVTQPRDSSLIARRLAAAPVVAVAAPDYLERRGIPRQPKDLTRHDCLVDTNFREGERWRFQAKGRKESITVDGPFRVNSPVSIVELAVAGHGVALAPHFLVETELREGRLREILRGRPDYDWGVYAVYPRRRHLAGRVRAYIDHLAEVLG